MRISVISPIHHSGATMVSIMLAQVLAKTQNMDVMLTYTGRKRHMCEYTGVSSVEDKTRSISQVVKLLEAHAISPSDIYDYSIRVDNNLSILDLADPSISDKDSYKLLPYVFKNVTSDITICDIFDEIYEETVQELIKESDIVVMVIQPDKHSYDMLEKWKQSPYWPKDKSIMVVVNRYNEEIAALRDISKKIGIAHINVCKLHYNPYITKFSNVGQSLTVLPYVLQKDPRVIELNTDLKEMCQYVVSTIGTKLKWEV